MLCDSCNMATATKTVRFVYPDLAPSQTFKLCGDCLSAALPNPHLEIGDLS